MSDDDGRDESSGERRPPEREEISDPPESAPGRDDSAGASDLDSVLGKHGTPSFFPQDADDDLGAYLDQLIPSLPPPGQAADESGPLPMPRRPDDGGEQSDVVPLPRSEPPGGLATSILRPSRPPDDEGALAALRSLPRRASPRPPQLPLSRWDAEGDALRAELLERLAGTVTGAPRGRLWCAAAEMHERAGNSAKARSLHEAARAENPADVVVLRELRKRAVGERDAGAVASLLAEEERSGLSPRERAEVLTLMAELSREAAPDRALAHAERASGLDSHALVPGLLVAELHAQQGNHGASVQALQSVAERVGDGPMHSALLLEAGYRALAGGDARSALSLSERAQRETPEAPEPRLLGYRAARRAGDTRSALDALAVLEEGVSADAELSAQVARMRARITLDVRGNAADAVDLLAGAKGPLSQRLAARAVQSLGDPAARRAALRGWAEASGGTEHALAEWELGCLHADADEGEAACEALEAATRADQTLSLNGALRDRLMRAGYLEQEAGDEDALQAAAQLAPAGGPRELVALTRAREEGGEPIVAAVLEVDAAIDAGHFEEVADGLKAAAARLAPERRVGPLLTLAELAEARSLRGHDPARVLADAAGAAPHSLIVSLARCRLARDDAERAELWFSIAANTRGETSAWAATQAGFHLSRAGRGSEAARAYELALDEDPEHGPALWAWELTRGYLPPPPSAHAAAAARCAGHTERGVRLLAAAHAFKLDGQPQVSREHLELASNACPRDLWLSDQLMQAGGDGSAKTLARGLEQASAQATSQAARTGRLRAAAAYEDAREPARAAALYQQVLEKHPQDAHASVGLDRTLAEAGLSGLLFERLERQAQQAADPEARLQLWTRLALELSRAGEHRRAKERWRSIAEAAPTHAMALRALERDAMSGDDRGLAQAEAALSRGLSDPRDRREHLRLRTRLLERLGEDREAEEGLRRGENEVEVDPWLAERLYRIAEGLEAELTTRSALALSGMSRDAVDAASLALRAAEPLTATLPERAIETLAKAARAAPEHPRALEDLGRLLQRTGRNAEAAEAFALAADHTEPRQRRVRLWYRAGTLWQDGVGDEDRALYCFARGADTDVLHRDLFVRARDLYTRNGDQRGLVRLLERRIERGGDAGTLAALHVERARLYAELDELTEAQACLSAALELQPERLETLMALAELHVRAEQWRDAADVLIRLARGTRERALLKRAFSLLGSIYVEHLPDPRRAEIALTRVVSLAPDDPVPVEQLVRVYRQRDEHDKALRAIQRVLELSRDRDHTEHWQVELSQTLLALDREPLAERALEQARQQNPASLVVNAALTELYRKQGDEAALTIHTDRTIHAVSDALVADPTQQALWSGLHGLHLQRAHDDAARTVAAIAADLEAADPELAPKARGHVGLGREVQSAEAQRRLRPRELGEALLNIARALDAVSARSAAALLEGKQARKLDKLPTSLGRAIERACELVGTARPAVWVARDYGECLPLATQPPALLIDEALPSSAGTDELTFLATRALAIAQARLCLTSRTPAAELQLLLDALGPSDDDEGGEDTGPDAEALARARRLLTEALGGGPDAGLSAALFQARASGELKASRLTSLSLRFGNQAAVGATGQVGAAIRALLVRDGVSLDAPLCELLGDHAEARSVLAFALSDTHLEARRELLETS